MLLLHREKRTWAYTFEHPLLQSFRVFFAAFFVVVAVVYLLVEKAARFEALIRVARFELTRLSCRDLLGQLGEVLLGSSMVLLNRWGRRWPSDRVLSVDCSPALKRPCNDGLADLHIQLAALLSPSRRGEWHWELKITAALSSAIAIFCQVHRGRDSDAHSVRPQVSTWHHALTMVTFYKGAAAAIHSLDGQCRRLRHYRLIVS